MVGTVQEVAEAGRAAAAGAAEAANTVALIAEKIGQWKRVRAETSSVVRLLYLEVCKDLELLSVLIDDKDKGIAWNDKRMRFFVDNFETQVMEMVLLGNEKEDVYKKLAAKGRVSDKNDLAGRGPRSVLKYENVLQALRFVYVKIDLLRKLLAEDAENELLKKVKVIERMKNIEERLVLAKRILGDLEENRTIA